ncbi:MAG: hypothetical protein CMJ52_08085 [Planctomycetaceae bacterium]|nr:hypothetical protein [Planctomycetaceae bacterium]
MQDLLGLLGRLLDHLFLLVVPLYLQELLWGLGLLCQQEAAVREQVVPQERGLEPRLELGLGRGQGQVWAVQRGQQQGRGLGLAEQEQELELELVQLQGQGLGLVEQLGQGRARDPWQGRARGKCR